MEKYGFVYIWYDIKRQMYYIGCHWGTENDGYICSSNRMRDAYRRRPNDFKRRIISRVYTSRQDLLTEEYRYLEMIRDNELKIKYYNLTKYQNGHWTTSENNLSIKEKIKKTHWSRKENASNIKKIMSNSAYNRWNVEARLEYSNKFKSLYKNNDELKQKISKGLKKAHKEGRAISPSVNMSEEHKTALSLRTKKMIEDRKIWK